MIPRRFVPPAPVVVDEDVDPAWCKCGDPDVTRLADLIAAGWSQADASLALWDRPEFFRRLDPSAPR